MLPDIPVSYARYFSLGAFDGEFDSREGDGRGRGLMAGPSMDSQVRHVGMDRCRVVTTSSCSASESSHCIE
jgi:hypothetical protein